LIRNKVERLFVDWVILIEFNNAIIQAKSINEYFEVKSDQKITKQTIKEKAEDLINSSKIHYEELK